jgi:hypothetical protein
MLPARASAHRPLPVPGLAAAVLGGLSATVPGLFSMVWLVLAAGVVALVAILSLDNGGGLGPYGVLTLLMPLGTAVLGALPGVRHWVRDRRSTRRGH